MECLVSCAGVGLCFFVLYFLLKSYRYKQKITQFGDKYVLITGCDSGFGNRFAKRLDVLGFHVFAACLTEKGKSDLTSTCSKNVVPFIMDVSRDESIEQGRQEVAKQLPSDKGLWAIVNNAGVIGTLSGPSYWASRADYDNVLSVNLYGVAMVTNAFLPLVFKAKGRVINTSSILGRFGFGNAAYSVSKYGVEALSDTLRRDVYKRGVSVHIVEPGFFKTPLLDATASRKRLAEKLKKLPDVYKADLPPDIEEKMHSKLMEFIDTLVSTNIDLVVEAYEHATTAKYPEYRYLCGTDAKFLFRPLWLMPEWASDFLITRGLE